MEWTSGFIEFRFLFQKGSNCHPLTNSIRADKVKHPRSWSTPSFCKEKCHIFLLSLTLLSEKTHSDLAASRQRKFKGHTWTARLLWSRDTRNKEYSWSSFTSSRYTSNMVISLLTLHVMLFTYLRITWAISLPEDFCYGNYQRWLLKSY